jgi:CheY-like chemotaxis protein
VREAAPDAPPRSRAVLVVENDDAVRALIRLALAGGAFAVVEAADGDAALALARRRGGPGPA